MMKNYYEIIVLTAAYEEYASTVLDFIEKNQKYFSHRLFKNHCILKQNFYLFKNLNVLTKNRLIKDIIIVDNIVRNFALFICNGIPIIDYKGTNDDFELCKLSNFLVQLASNENCTEFIRNNIVKSLLKNE